MKTNIRSFVVINLNRAGYDALEADHRRGGAGEAARTIRIPAWPCWTCMLPGIDGFEVCRRIRATNTKIGIIMLTARTQEMDKVTGLMTGADDYVTKPFSPAELTARVDALYRRSGGGGEAGRQRRDLPAPLPAQHPQPDAGEERPAHQADPGGVLRHEAVYGQPGQGPVPGGDPGVRLGAGLLSAKLKIVDVNIRRLRLKVEDDPTNPTYITTVWGYGYKWGF